jgi:DnaJ-class molecular chaperone
VSDAAKTIEQRMVDQVEQLSQKLIERNAEIKRLRDVFRPEPYTGLRGKILCSHCQGQGEVNGRNSDDPRWVQCPTCGGDGLTKPAREALAREG